MLTALILICSIAVASDPADCTRSNADTIMRVPTEFGSPATCFMQAQAYLAQSSVGQDLDGNELVKVVCLRSDSVAGVHAGVHLQSRIIGP
jgi:hypothetical protein